jgi:hypothetical protein
VPARWYSADAGRFVTNRRPSTSSVAIERISSNFTSRRFEKKRSSSSSRYRESVAIFHARRSSANWKPARAADCSARDATAGANWQAAARSIESGNEDVLHLHEQAQPRRRSVPSTNPRRHDPTWTSSRGAWHWNPNATFQSPRRDQRPRALRTLRRSRRRAPDQPSRAPVPAGGGGGAAAVKAAVNIRCRGDSRSSIRPTDASPAPRRPLTRVGTRSCGRSRTAHRTRTHIKNHAGAERRHDSWKDPDCQGPHRRAR